VRRVLRKGSQQFNILKKREIQSHDRLKEFRDKTSALNFLRGLMRDNPNTIILRNIVKQKLSQSRFSKAGERKVLEHLASQLVNGRLKITMLPIAIPTWSYHMPAPEAEQEEEPIAVVQPAADEPRLITNARWGQGVARRGDIVKILADTQGISDGTEALIGIYEHDRDGAHDFITKFTTPVKQNKIESKWDFEYHKDTDEIPTAEESEKGYNPPEYFFEVTFEGQKAKSGLLEFKDWIEIKLVNILEEPAGDEEYILHLPDGQQRKGKLDSKGYAIERDIPPGKCKVEFPNYGQ
jgi:hypothetical protein